MNGDQLVDAFPNTISSASRILKHEERIARRFRNAVKDLINRFGDARDTSIYSCAEM